MGPRYYLGGIFWVDADVSDDRMEEQFHGILRELKPSETPDLATFRELRRNAAEELARALHEASGRGPILYVVDNVPEPGAGRPRRPIETWCPALGKVGLLVTSRLKLLKTDNLRPLTVDVLAPEAAVALLSEGIRGETDTSVWGRIAEWVGYLPLALELLNKAMESGGVTPRELLAKVEQGPVRELDRQMEALREQVAPGSLRGVTEALTISFERLSEPARHAARLLAWLAPEPIPLALLEALGPELSSPAVRSALVMRHFVRAADGAPVPMFGGMHRVLADFLRTQSQDPGEDLTRLCEALNQIMPEATGRDTRQWPLMNACLPHAEMILAHRRRLDVRAGAEDEVILGQSLLNSLLAKGLAARARGLGESLIQRACTILGEEHRETIVTMSLLATALCDEGSLIEARDLQTRTLERCRRLLSAEDLVTLTAKSGLARILDAQGDSAGAQAIYEEVLEPMRRQLGPDHEIVLSVLNNLGHVFYEQRRYDKARALLEQVVAARRGQGNHHPGMFTTMSNLAATLASLGDIAGARILRQQALDLRRQTMGEDHPRTLNSMSSLALSLRSEGALDEASDLSERAVEGHLRILGPEHSATLAAMNGYATILRDQRRFAEAISIHEKVIEACRKTLGEDHPKTLTAMGNLAGTLTLEGNLQRARGIQKRILSAHLRLHGNEHPSTTIAALNYFHTLHQLGKHREAQRTLNEHLLWLLKRAPETLEADQRDIRERVLKLVGPSPSR